METYSHGPMNSAKTLRQRFRVLIVALDLPERGKRSTSSREEDGVDAQMCPCGIAIESRTHIVRECEMYKEERDVIKEEGIRGIDECDVEEFDTLDSTARKRSLSQEKHGGRRRPNKKGM